MTATKYASAAMPCSHLLCLVCCPVWLYSLLHQALVCDESATTSVVWWWTGLSLACTPAGAKWPYSLQLMLAAVCCTAALPLQAWARWQRAPSRPPTPRHAACMMLTMPPSPQHWPPAAAAQLQQWGCWRTCPWTPGGAWGSGRRGVCMTCCLRPAGTWAGPAGRLEVAWLRC